METQEHCSTPEAYQLLHDGSIALAQISSNGIRVDREYTQATFDQYTKKMVDLRSKLTRDKDVWPIWRREFGGRANLGSSDELAHVLFNKMGFQPAAYTDTGKPSTDEAALSEIDHPFVRRWAIIKKMDKLTGTFIQGILRESCKGPDDYWYMHPNFYLFTTVTYRSSSTAINFQNLPKRDKRVMKLVRRCFRPRPGNQLVEMDYGQAEVRIANCYHHDPTMTNYNRNPKACMHRDTAADLFACQPHEINGDIRFIAKNSFVFAQFYGDYWGQCAPYIWDSIRKSDPDDMVIRGKHIWEHLEDNDVLSLGPKDRPPYGTFMHKVKEVERIFWKERFPVYDRWKKQWFHRYENEGGFRTLTGFWIHGDMGRNDVINYPVQGVAFHCLLWSVIQIQKWLKSKGFKSVIVGQIHDAIVFDCPPNERDEVMAYAKYIMTEAIVEHWPWIIVPMIVDAEVSAVDGNWSEMEKVKI